MRLFRKKTSTKELSLKQTFKSVICIPGNWNSWDEFKLSIIPSSKGEYIAIGNILMNAKKSRHYTIDFCERDEKMKEAFKYAGMVTRVTDTFLNEIENHKYVIYLSGTTGSLEEAEHIAMAASAVLKAGGLGIKIETAGKAFEKDKWLNLTEIFEPSHLYKMFVVDSIVNKDRTVYSCGMQNLGFKDTIISGEEFQYAVSLISLFSYYQIVDKPTIIENQTFSADEESPIFRITDEQNQPNKGDELFGNPFGMWRLTRL